MWKHIAWSEGIGRRDSWRCHDASCEVMVVILGLCPDVFPCLLDELIVVQIVLQVSCCAGTCRLMSL